jgi:hypothetical protein
MPATIHSSRVPISSILQGKKVQNIVIIQAFWYNTLKNIPMYEMLYMKFTTLSTKLASIEIQEHDLNKVTQTILKSHASSIMF